MRILAAQLNPTIGDLQHNTQKIIEVLAEARAKGCDLVLFPEMSLCGYPPEDLLFHSTFIDEMEHCLDKVIEACTDISAIVGLVRRNPQKGERALLNSAAVIQNGKLLGFHDKWLLPTYDVFDERRYFQPGSSLQVWNIGGKRVGLLICEDIWGHAGYTDVANYPCDPVQSLQPLKPDILLNMSASPYQFQKLDTRLIVCKKAAQTLSCPVLLCCQVGGNDQLIFDGYSILVDKEGELRSLAKGFEEDLMLVDLDRLPPVVKWQEEALCDLYHALVLGVRDYFHKSHFCKGCLGISGGIDSALVACIAVDALGKENVTGICMPSQYTSSSSIVDAKELAHNLGIHYREISIEEPFESFLELLLPHFEGLPPDITEENMQARIRGLMLMALSNKLGCIVLSTGNKSEMAMGYCTLYGDTCGGLSVISDVTKMQVYALAKWINRKGEIIPQSTIDKAPSAELRPNQKDSDSLPDYSVIDAVLQGYVEELLSPEEIAQKEGLSLNLVFDLIHRIHRAEYKRRQAPPGIRVSKKAFRVGRRYPIVQRWM
jgi:NAD+ synthase (glutamine-hydrolysing)